MIMMRMKSKKDDQSLFDDDDKKQIMIKKDHKYLIGMELRETERNYVTMLSNIIQMFKIELEKRWY